MTPLFHYLRTGLAIAVASAQVELVYRFKNIVWVVQTLLWVLVYPTMWLAVYDVSGDLFGFTPTTIVTYFIGLAVLDHITESYADQLYIRQIRDGGLSQLLVKPYSFVGFIFFKNVGERFVPMVIIIALSAAVVALFDAPVHIPTQGLTWVWLGGALLVGHLLAFQLKTIVGSLAFWIEEASPISWIYWIVISVFTGWVCPLVFLPGWAQQISSYLPWQYITYTPLMIYLEQLPTTALYRSAVL